MKSFQSWVLYISLTVQLKTFVYMDYIFVPLVLHLE